LPEFVCARSAPLAAKHSATQNIFPEIFLGISQLAALLQSPPLDPVIVKTRMGSSRRHDLFVRWLHIT